jgi:hypothetical protein
MSESSRVGGLRVDGAVVHSRSLIDSTLLMSGKGPAILKAGDLFPL